MTNEKKPTRNLTMLTDFYEITMSNGYFSNGYRDTLYILTCFSDMSRTTVALQLWLAFNSWLSILKI